MTPLDGENPDRIEALMDALDDIWERNPDLRLGQIIVNVVMLEYGPDRRLSLSELFSMEDDAMLRGLRGLLHLLNGGKVYDWSDRL